MASHTDLFTIVGDSDERSHSHSRPTSPLRASPVSTTPILPPPPPDSYWGDAERRYPPHKTEPLEASLLPPIRASGRYSSESAPSSDPTLDFSGLIPMYDAAARSPRQLLEMPYPNGEWAGPQHYPPYARNGEAKQQQPLWLPPPDGAFPHPPQPTHWGSSVIPQLTEYPRFSPQSSASASPPPPYYPHHHPLPPPHPNPHVHPYLPRGSAPSTSRAPTGGGASTPPSGSAKKSCSHCHVTTTPLWRRDPSTQRPLCNACGLYLQQRNKLRPQELIDADNDDLPGAEDEIPDEEYTGPKCSHCLTRHTSVWRRSKTGQQVCNACGVYARLRGKERPLSLRRNKIKPRTKHSR